MVFATKTALSLLGHRVLVLDAERERLNLLLGELVKDTAPQLLEIHGVGVDTAATLLVTAGDNPGRIRSEVIRVLKRYVAREVYHRLPRV